MRAKSYWGVGLLIVVLALSFSPVFASTPTPIPPTATIVPLNIDLSPIFVQANQWLQTLSPIESLSIGIVIALAVFGFLYKAIRSAFG